MTKKNCKYPEWLSEYTFDNCKLNRKEYGEFLVNYLLGEHDGFVLNLNGAWGTGKTEFLRRLYTLLTYKGHPTIYIDAWESDFSEIPLSVVSSELVNQLSCINENIGNDLEKVGEFLGKALKGTIIGGAGLLSKHFLGDASAGTEVAKALFEQSPKDFLDSVKGNHAEQVDAIKQIRHQLEILAEVIKANYGCALPVVVLVDELDRCRPNYAIEMLEVIKHFFTTKNFVFVVATDTCQLRESIKAIYGAEFDSTTYLKRFFNREARLEEPDLDHYIGLSKFDINEYANKVILYPNIRNSETNTLHSYLTWAAKAYELSLRDVDQLISKLKACLRAGLDSYNSSEKLQLVNVFSLIIALVEFDKGHLQFHERKNNTPITEGNFNNIEIDAALGHDSALSDFYELNMHRSVMHEVFVKDSWGEEGNRLVFGTHPHSNGREATNYKGVTRSALSNISELFQRYEQEDKRKIWLWEDYQKVVKLAGSIQ
jgi:hypothetical protein